MRAGSLALRVPAAAAARAQGDGAAALRVHAATSGACSAYERVPGRVRFFLDTAVYADTARALLPEIAGYGAGLINHLFRAEIRIDTGTAGAALVSVVGARGAAFGRARSASSPRTGRACASRSRRVQPAAAGVRVDGARPGHEEGRRRAARRGRRRRSRRRRRSASAAPTRSRGEGRGSSAAGTEWAASAESRAAGAAPASPARRLPAARSLRPGLVVGVLAAADAARVRPSISCGSRASASARNAAAAAVARRDRRAHGPGQKARRGRRPRASAAAAWRNAGRAAAGLSSASAVRPRSNSGHGFSASSSLAARNARQRRVLPPEAHEREPRACSTSAAPGIESSARARPGAARSRA